MRVTVLALGSRGDVQPFIALGQGLTAAGHEVRIAAAADYESLVRAYGLAFAPLVGSIRTLMDPQVVAAIHSTASNPFRVAYHFFRTVNPLIYQLIHDCAETTCDADVIVMSTLGQYCGYRIAQERGVPQFVVHMHPYTPTRALPHIFFPQLPGYLPLQSTYNRLTHQIVEHAFWQLLRRSLNHAQSQVLGLKSVGPIELYRRVASAQLPAMLAYSPHIAPPPDDWSNSLVVTGHWHLEQPPGWLPPIELRHFLAAGPTPVYISFGSMLLGPTADQVTSLVVRALQERGLRGILHRGWGDIGNSSLPPDILAVDSVPHDWLLPRVRLVVHHGGAGVMAATLRAGVPMVVVPFLGDQHFWARRLTDLGVAPAPLPRIRLSQERLGAALDTALSTPAMQQRSAVLGQLLRKEQGVARAVEYMESYLGALRERPSTTQLEEASMMGRADAAN